MIQIHGDYREIEAEFARLESLPNPKGAALLDAILDTTFTETQAAVHVITGSLKSSGKKDSYVKEHTWYGDISYGGPSLGVNNPVDYAIYEKARGGSHDFLRSAESLGSIWVAAIKKILGGGK